MKGILFLCVANSARSQIAEGIARHLLPRNISVFSAGSRPTEVRSEAIAVLSEIGIDISSQYSKPVDEIPLERIDVTITLCAEEECPFFPGNVRRIHWGLTDPAAVTGSEADRMIAFRKTRDELISRIQTLCSELHWGSTDRKSSL